MSERSVTVVDYGVGNLLSVRRAFEHLGARVTISADHWAMRDAERLVLPGVGAFGNCAEALGTRGLNEIVLNYVGTERPFLGICVGMQLLFTSSDEFGQHEGLNILAGSVTAIPGTDDRGRPHKIPHIGWTALEVPDGCSHLLWQNGILRDIQPGTPVYFVHSFTASPVNSGVRLADAHYNGRLLSAAVCENNITATQFHPEKSGAAGLQILSNFLDL